MTRIVDHRDLEVWQRAMHLAVAIFEMTTTFPPDETFGLRAQLRRAAFSVPSNIAEGHSRGTHRNSRGSFASLAGRSPR